MNYGKPIIAGSLIIALALSAGAFLVAGRYEMVRDNDYGVYRLDRWTGAIALCSRWADDSLSCANAPELYHDGSKSLKAKEASNAAAAVIPQ